MAGLARRSAQRFFAQLTRNWIFWSLLVAVTVGMPLIRSLTRELPPPPPAFATLPSFEFIDEEGRPYGLADLKGRVWVASFVVTGNGETTNRVSTRMAELQSRLVNMGDAVRLVTITADPDRDTPQVLREYARQHRARREAWKFLSGPSDGVVEVVAEGLESATGASSTDTALDLVESGRLVLVDQLGRVRGYFAADDEGVQALPNAAGLLANRGPALEL
jgi:protein SCO1/2